MKYIYTQNPTAKVPIIVLDKYIGIDAQGNTGILGSQFTTEVLALQNAGVTNCEVWINSKGGQWSEGASIVGSMRNSSIEFTTKNLGYVDSTAGHIFQAGNKRVWENYSVGLIHEIQGGGNDYIKEALNTSIATMLQEKTNRTVAQVRELMTKETLMTAQMAKEYGFADEFPIGNILAFTNSNEAAEYGQKQIQKLLPKKKSMEAINAILGLTNEASETAQLKAINDIVAAKNAAETKSDTLTAQLSNTTELLTATNEKLNTANATIIAAENAVKVSNAKTFLTPHIGKRISNDPTVVAGWEKMLTADFEGTKVIIEGINYNATAPATPTLQTQGTANSNVVISAAQHYQKHNK